MKFCCKPRKAAPLTDRSFDGNVYETAHEGLLKWKKLHFGCINRSTYRSRLHQKSKYLCDVVRRAVLRGSLCVTNYSLE